MNDRSIAKPGRWGILLQMVVSVLFFFGLQPQARADIAFVGSSSAIGTKTGAAAVTYRGVGTESSGVTTATPGLPGGWQPGDLHLLLVTAQANDLDRVDTPSGWTLVWEQFSGTHYAGIYRRIAQSGDVAPSITNKRDRGIVARIVGFYGIDQANPINVASSQYAGGNTLATPPTTTTVNNAMLLLTGHWAASGHDIPYTSVGPLTWTPPGATWTQSFFSYNNSIPYTAGGGGGGTYRAGLTAFFAPMATAGNISGFNAQLDPNNNAYIYSGMLAIRPGVNQSITLTPSAGSAGDVLVASISVRHYQANVTPPAGWTLIQDTPQSNGAGTCNSGSTDGIRTLTYYKVAGASEPAATWGYSSSCDDDGFAAGGMLRFSGVDTTNPIIASAEATTGSGTLHQAPAVTPGVANSMLVTVHSYGSSRLWNEGYAGVNSMAERVDQRSYGSDNALGTTLGMYTEPIPGTASTGTRTAQGAGDADNGATHSLLLRPGLHHVRIEHDGAGDMCNAETLSVKACANSNCTSLYLGGVSNITLSTSNGTITTPVTIAPGSGSATTTLTASAIGTAIVSASKPANATNNSDCYDTVGGTASCNIAIAACFDHIRIEHDGVGDTCGPKAVTLKACANASCSSLYNGSVTTALSASSGSWSANPITFSGGSASASLTVTAASTVTVGASKPAGAANFSDCYNTTGGTTSCSINVTACGAACATSLSGVVNTYYPGIGTVAANSTTVSLGPAVGASTALKPNDVVLVIQMQDATINSSNLPAYGANNNSGSGATSIGNSGLYEYKVVSSFNSSTGVVTFTSGLTNSYSSAAATAAAGQKTFQVIRVPVLASYTLSTPPTALPWNGSAGGVLAFDVAGTLTFSGSPTISVDGQGFSGGPGRQARNGSGARTDYRTNAGTNGANGAKGEGIAGKPSSFDDSRGYGYPNGSNAQGAPGNAGGGGTDGNPAANDENTGGGGGAGYGNGGRGGIGWCGGFSASSPPYYGCSNSGGLGGTGVPQSASRLSMGGGGGAATSNDGTGSPGNGVASSGAAGGGLIFVRAGSLSGSATFSAKGANANNTVCNDGSGGGGAGGAVLIEVGSGNGLNNVSIDVQGGAGGTNLDPAYGCGNSTNPHGPGGGGGGGYAVTSVVNGGSAIPAVCTANGGAAGETYRSGTKFVGNYGAVAGSIGACGNSTGSISIGQSLGYGPCIPSVDHYAITLSSTQGVTCQPETVTVIPHTDTHGAVTMDATTTIKITATLGPGNGGGAAKGDFLLNTGGGTFTPGTADAGGNGAAATTYTFGLGETSVKFDYKNTWAQTVNFNVSTTAGGNATERSGSASADNPFDPDLAFATAALRFVDVENKSIGNQVAGVTSGQYYLQAIQSSCSTPGAACAGVCSSIFGNGKTVGIELAYECNNPDKCSCKSAPATCVSEGNPALTVANTGGTTAQIQGNDNGSSLSYTTQNLTFNNVALTGCTAPCSVAPVTINFTDVGQIKLHARYSAGPGGGGAGTALPSTPVPIFGNAQFVVKPYSLVLTDIKQTASPGTANPAAAGASGSKFVYAGEAFSATVTAVNASCSSSLGSYTLLTEIPKNCKTPNYGKESTAEGAAITSSLVTDLGLTNNPSVDNNSSFGSFSGGSATGTTFKWGEVGIIKLTPNIGDDDYLGAGKLAPATADGSVTTTTGNVGRFYAHHFGLTGAVQTRSDLLPGTGSVFTYMGEPMKLSLTVTAYNSGDVKTQNYAGGFAKLSAADLGTTARWFNTGCTGTDQCFGLGAVNDAATGKLGLTDRLVIETATSTGSSDPAGTWTTGVGTFTLFLSLARPTTSVPDASWGPYKTLKFGAMPRDSDGVTLPGPTAADTAHRVDLDAAKENSKPFGNPDATNERRLLFTTDVRYGRFYLGNAFGSEYLPLKVPAAAQYWVGGGWVHNTDDSLTTLTVPTQPTGLSFPLVNPRSVLVVGDAIARMGEASPMASATSGTKTLKSGDAWLWLTGQASASKGPGAGKYGYVDVIASGLGIPSYLMMPGNVRVCFGTCGPRSPIIYLRERY